MGEGSTVSHLLYNNNRPGYGDVDVHTSLINRWVPFTLPRTAVGLAKVTEVAVVGRRGVAETVEEQEPVPTMVLMIPEGVTIRIVQRA